MAASDSDVFASVPIADEISSNSGTGIVKILCSDSGISHACGVQTQFSERFSELFALLERMTKQDWSNESFAEFTKTDKSAVGKARTGRPFPLKYLDAWGRGFGLKGADLKEFVRLGKSSEAIKDGKHGSLVQELLAENRALSRENEKLLGFCRQVVEGLDKHRDKLPHDLVHLLRALGESL